MKIASPRSLALLATALLASAAQGAISLEVTGGNGSPLTITLLESVTYTIAPGAPEDNFPIFVIDEATTGTPFDSNVTGTMTFSINDGDLQSFIYLSGGVNAADLTANDIYFYRGELLLEEGDTITLHAGYLTTASAVNAVPAGGSSFESFMINNMGTRITGDAVPEPSAAALLGLGAAGFVLRRRRK